MTLVALVMTGCAPTERPPVVEAPSAAPPAQSADNATNKTASLRDEGKHVVARTPMEAYKRAAAEHILEANRERMMLAQPQALLRAVIVVKIKVQSGGQTTAEILRAPDRTLAAHAIETIKRASPLPAPPQSVAAELARHGFTETWLYNSDGRFHLRTLAPPQLTE
ncbi:MAG TPA: hypothetical protein VFS42_11490 [Burkholderiaceae bacterium]|nr:hypothetical protein [Burkholderiaceae bacterium]